MDITVGRLGHGDESILVDIVVRHKHRLIGIDYAERLLENPSNFLLVAERGQSPVGFAWGYLLSRLDRDKLQLFIYEVDVSSDARRRGVGTSLMNFVAACTQENRLMEAFVLADPANVAAHGLYRNIGA